MDLRDYFAAHLAAALAGRLERPEVVASRAYELADALLMERARRASAGPSPLEEEDELGLAGWASYEPPGLLDPPAALEDEDDGRLDEGLAERDLDPRWDVEPKWTGPTADPAEDARPASDRPGLARTSPPPSRDERSRRPA